MKRLTTVAAVVAGGIMVAGQARAQLPGIPVYNTVVATGLTLAGDVAFPNDNSGLSTSYGATGALGLGIFGFTASLGATKVDATGQTEVSFGGTANWKIFGGPLIPLALNLQGGAAYWEADFPGTPSKIKNLRVPVGISATLTIPTPGMAIKPWIAPRVEYRRSEPDGQNSVDHTDFAWSAGIELAFLGGLGVHAAYDWLRSDGVTSSTVGVGASFGL